MENFLLQKIYSIHKKKLRNLKIKNKKILICFSGIPASGKTTIAKILEKKYKGIRINNDLIRKYLTSLRKNYSPDEIDKFVMNYLFYFFRNYNFPNKLFILDSSIDRRYPFVKKFADENQFKIFVITLQISKKTATGRAFQRNKGIDIWFNKNISRWIKENKEFNKKYKTDVKINSDGEINLSKIFVKLDLFLK